jgi:predicted NBD/HSP70 family sugar kinase
MSAGADAPRQRIGVDLGGTKIEAIVLELPRDADATPIERARARIPTQRDLGYEHVIEATRAIVLDVAKQASVDPLATPIGVGMPGGATTRTAEGGRSPTP